MAADVELMQLREEEAELTQRLGAVSLEDGDDAAAPADEAAAAAPPVAHANGSAGHRPGTNGAVSDADADSDGDDASDDDDDDRCSPRHCHDDMTRT